MFPPVFSDTGIPLPIRPRAIAFDLDGTLLDYDGHLSESVARAVRQIGNTDIRVFIATGRLLAGAEKYWRELELNTPIVSCNGASIGFPGESPLYETTLDAEVRDIVLDLEKRHDLYINYYLDNSVYTLKDGAERDFYSRQYVLVALARDREDILSRALPTKCLCITSEADQAGAIRLLSEALRDRAVITTSNNRFIEILPIGADKGSALQRLSEWSGIPTDRFIAVGDGMNDLPMLQKAGFAISFRTADRRLAEHVDMLLPPLWEDGIEILAKCILGLTNSGRFLTARSSRFFKK